MNIFAANPKPGDLPPLTSAEFEILLSLAGGDRHGYAIMQEIAERSDGAAAILPGTLYRAISRLLDSGLVAETGAPARGRGVRDRDADERRRYYALTTLGRRVAGIEARRLARQVDTARARKILKAEG